MKLIYPLAFILLFCSCRKDGPVTYKDPVNNAFSLTLSPDWYLVNLRGIDTYVGYYHNSSVKIYFDHGALSFGSIKRIQTNATTLYYEELMINGCHAKIVKENHPDGIRLSAYIDKGDGQHLTRLFTYYPADEEALIRIFKTHRFN